MSLSVTFTGYYLENKTANHHKYYLICVSDDGLVTTSWGRIGTNGQSKVQRFPSTADATALAMKQFYSKRSGGYEVLVENLKFTVDEQYVQFAEQQSNATYITSQFWMARRDPSYQADKEAVLTHYEDLLNKAQRLMADASTMNFEAVQAQFEELEGIWSEIEDKHDEVKITMDFTKQMLGAALLSGKL